jgi:radical SAM superfamily enzyme YgiQ (UPF0313 family)
MSNLGLRIIYGLLNEHTDFVCERVFMPGLDLAEYLKQNNITLFSLETKTPLRQFDILGFNFGYELNFTNFLMMLSLAHIPLETKDRKNTIIFGGGIANPEPLAEFVDIFCLGEFEANADIFVEILRKYKTKDARLEAFAEREGFYVPSFYSVELKNNRYVFEKKYPYACFPLKRAHTKDLNNVYYPTRWLTPYQQLIHDRAQVEIARGCPNYCAFCQARQIYFPYREKKVSVIKETIKNIYENSGYENFSLLSLSASDHSCIEEIIDETYEYCEQRKIGLALPSLRIDDITGRLYKRIVSLKKASLTLAVEAASEHLREKMNKKININRLFEAAEIIRGLNTKQIKVYFMFGLPYEQEEDLVAIGNFLSLLQKGIRCKLNASINIFVPKPFSKWQAVIMDPEEVLEFKKDFIYKHIPKTSRIKISLSFTKKSILEAILARADRKFSSVIKKAFNYGAKFDGYSEFFSWEVWRKVIAEEQVDSKFYLEAQTENFPWSLIV